MIWKGALASLIDACFLIALASIDAGAATIELVAIPSAAIDYNAANQQPSCHVRLRGAIEKGDRGRLDGAIKRLRNSNADHELVLCLASPGGDYSETLRIVEYLLMDEGVGISTLVDAGHECLSACALLFMAGNFVWDHGQVPARNLHVAGRLGFHAPYIPDSSLPDRTFSREELINAYRAATAAAQKIIALLGSQGWREGVATPTHRMKASLLREMLAKGPSEFVYIDNIDQAGRWDIGLVGIPPPSGLTSEMAIIGCLNYIGWKVDEPSRFKDGDSGRAGSVRREATDYDTRFIYDIGSYDGARCTVSQSRGAGTNKHLTITIDGGNGGGSGTLDKNLLRPPETLLSSLALKQPRPERQLRRSTASRPEITNLASMANSDIDGGDYRKAPNSSATECATMCGADHMCNGYSFDKWNRWCFLKSSVGELRFDPQSVSGVKEGAGQPSRSSAPLIMQRYRSRTFPPSAGESAAQAASFEACEKRCEAAGTCVAVTYVKTSRQCRLIVDAGEYLSDPNADSSVKRQTPSR